MMVAIGQLILGEWLIVLREDDIDLGETLVAGHRAE
jgi:hypothetical protein